MQHVLYVSAYMFVSLDKEYFADSSNRVHTEVQLCRGNVSQYQNNY